MRIVFVKSKEAKEKIKPALDAGNVGKTMAAPVAAIVGMDILSCLLRPSSVSRRFEHNFQLIELESVRLLRAARRYSAISAEHLGDECWPVAIWQVARPLDERRTGELDECLARLEVPGTVLEPHPEHAKPVLVG
jgi:3-hydroxypropanoate dehydrogenase